MNSNDEKKPDALSNKNLDNDQMYKKIKAQEMINRVKEKIESNDPAVLRTIKTFMDDSGKKKETPKK
jgi:hypothetical protein